MDTQERDPEVQKAEAPQRPEGFPAARVVFLAIAALWTVSVAWQAWQLPAGTGDDVGPRLVPLVVAGLVLVLILAECVLSMRSTSRGRPGSPPRFEQGSTNRVKRFVRSSQARFVAILLASCIALPVAGFGPTTAALALLTLLSVEDLSWRRALVAGVVLLAALYLIFIVVLELPLQLLPW